MEGLIAAGFRPQGRHEHRFAGSGFRPQPRQFVGGPVFHGSRAVFADVISCHMAGDRKCERHTAFTRSTADLSCGLPIVTRSGSTLGHAASVPHKEKTLATILTQIVNRTIYVGKVVDDDRGRVALGKR
jgi:hypothetical protein